MVMLLSEGLQFGKRYKFQLPKGRSTAYYLCLDEKSAMYQPLAFIDGSTFCMLPFMLNKKIVLIRFIAQMFEVDNQKWWSDAIVTFDYRINNEQEPEIFIKNVTGVDTLYPPSWNEEYFLTIQEKINMKKAELNELDDSEDDDEF